MICHRIVMAGVVPWDRGWTDLIQTVDIRQWLNISRPEVLDAL